MSHTRTRSRIMTLTLVLGLLVLCVPSSLFAKSGAKMWVGTWASSPLLDAKAKNAEELLGAGATLREVVHVSMGGDTIRVRFSKTYRNKIPSEEKRALSIEA